ncbi:MAG: helix-turn-helix domain-containing protein [Chloroflexota bacterium]
MSTLLSTQAVPEKERFDYWTYLISQSLGRLDTVSLGTPSFSGQINHNQLDMLDFVKLSSNKLTVRRTERLIAQESTNYFKANFHLYGEGYLRQNGREAYLKPGHWVLYDNTRPYHLEFKGDYRQLVVLIPKPHLVSRLVTVEAALAHPLSTQSGLGKVATDFMTSLLTEVENLPPQSQRQLVQTLLDLLVANLQEVTRPTPVTLPKPEIALLDVKAYIQQHLPDPQLAVDPIATTLHLSKRYIHHLFQREGVSVTRYIWNVRLEKCKADLSNPLFKHRTITEIAMAWGFSSSAHFSRLFKDRYGMSAREYRKNYSSL